MNRLIYMALAGTLVGLACEKLAVDLDNPLDPDSPSYTPPEVNIVSGPTEGEVVTVPVATFEWEGNELAIEYQYNFNNTGPNNGWSDWLGVTAITLDYLDEGDHRFRVQSRYPSGDKSDVATVNFVVDAVKGPALMLFPRRRVTSMGNTTSFQVLAEEVSNLTAAEFTVVFDPSFLEIISVDQGSIFQGEGESVFLSEYDNFTGEIRISTALLGGENPSVDGTGVLAIITFETQQKGQTTFVFDGSEILRDPANNPISVEEIVGGLAIIE